MKVIIAGERTLENTDIVFPIIDASPFEITEVVCGEARGVDTLGKRWALNKGVPVTSYPADWGKYGKGAGPIRNQQMADYADALIAIWFPSKSKGTKDMIKRAYDGHLHLYVVNLEKV